MDWHRLFGLILMDFFTGSPFLVEVEKDLSVKKQLLDVIILRKNPGAFPGRLPDGLEDLADFNLISFKSHQEALDDWTLKELTGHYVNYRKQISPSMQNLLPEEKFRLFAVCARYPQNLVGQVSWEELQQGVYRCRRGTDVIQVVVLRQLPQEQHNALWHLFSAVPQQVGFGATHYHQRAVDTSSLLRQLFVGYKREGLTMSYTMEDFRRDYTREHITDLTPEERLEGLSAEDILKCMPVEEVLKRLPLDEIEDYAREHLKDLTPEKRLEGLSAEDILKCMPAEEILKRLPLDEIEAFLKRHKNGHAPAAE